MKKGILGLLFTAIIFTAFSIYAYATDIIYSGTAGAEYDNLTWTLDSEGTLTISGQGAMSSNLPDWVTNEQIRNSIKKAVIEEGVTNISSAFDDCTYLTEVSIPDSVTSIADYAFYGCKSLKTIEIPESVEEIGEGVFSDCSSLENIHIPNKVKVIGGYAFSHCANLTSVTLPSGLMDIEEHAFSDCASLKDIEFPDTLESIGDYAFFQCHSLKKITLPCNTGEDAFCQSKGIEEVIIKDGVTSLSAHVFSNCKMLNKLVMPDSVTFIDEFALSGCPLNEFYYGGTKSQWKAVQIRRDGNEKLYDGDIKIHWAFDNSQEETSGKCGDDLTWTLSGDGSFVISGTGKMYDFDDSMWDANKEYIKSVVIKDGAVNIGKNAFSQCTELESVTLPDTVTDIGGGAFSECVKLPEINISSNVTNIGTGAFVSCGNLNIRVSQDNPNYSDIDGVLFDKNHTELLSYSKDKICSKYVIPDTVTTVSMSAFYGCKDLLEVKIPAEVTLIETGAFYLCEKLNNINIPDNVVRIGHSAFSGCASIKTITIPPNITELGMNTFSRCTNLENIILPDGITKIGSFAFQDCISLREFNIPQGVEQIEQWTFSGCSSLANITIHENIKSIDEYAFYNCNNIFKLEIKNGTTELGYNSFYSCDNLKYIILPKSLTTISSGAFNYSENISDVYYEGTEDEWNAMNIASGNSYLTNAAIHYNTTEIPMPEKPVIESISYSDGMCTFNTVVGNIPYTTNLICVLYNQDGAVTGTSMTKVKSTDTSVPVSVSGENAKSVKVFIWDSLNGMHPLCEAAEAEITSN